MAIGKLVARPIRANSPRQKRSNTNSSRPFDSDSYVIVNNEFVFRTLAEQWRRDRDWCGGDDQEDDQEDDLDDLRVGDGDGIATGGGDDKASCSSGCSCSESSCLYAEAAEVPPCAPVPQGRK